jgi:3-methyladenine DNA glycosylase AlkD
VPRRRSSAGELIAWLQAHGSETNRAGMARFGINTQRAFGISMAALRSQAKEVEPDHELAGELWQSGWHEARLLAALIDRPRFVTPEQMDLWTADFDSWDLCDQVCGNLWCRTPFAPQKIRKWADDEREFVRRAGFVTLAWMAVHDKKSPHAGFLDYLPLIRGGSNDPRNFVKKAVNWALRQIGKRSASLHGPCLELARELAASSDSTARWIGTDAARELESEKLRSRLKP